jgi:hypothetical protein
MEDEWDVDMDSVPDGDIGESSSSPIPSPSPQHLVPQRLLPQLPGEEKSKHTTTMREREGHNEFSQTQSIF